MKKVYLILVVFYCIISCNKLDRDEIVDKSTLLGSDYRLFQDTPAWILAKAVWDNDLEKINEEIKKNRKLLNYRELKYGKTLLHLCIYNDNFKSFIELLNLGANPDIPDLSHCSTPLVEACESFEGRTKYVVELIKHKANINYVECKDGKQEQKTNRTPLIYASIRGNYDLVELLVENGAKINFVNNNNEYALSSAVIAKHYDIVIYLLEHGANCNEILYKKYNADNSETPIYMRDWVETEEIKTSWYYSKIVKLLKEKGCL